jgi:hypothetical protein
MRSLRRPPQSVRPRPEAALRDAVLLVAPSPLDDAAPLLRGRPTSTVDANFDGVGRRVDVVATEVGLIIGSAGGPGREMPSLAPWAMVECSVDSEPVLLPDGSHGTALAVEVADEAWLGQPGQIGQPCTMRFGVPDEEMAAFLHTGVPAFASPRAVGAAHARRTGRSVAASGTGAGLLVRLRAATGRWTRSIQPGTTDPQHGLGRRRVGPATVGLLALVLLAGSTSISYESSASGVRHLSGAAHALSAGNQVQDTQGHTTPDLPVATSAPAPAPPTLAASAPLQSHEIFGYAPYWTLPQSSGFDVQDLTTLAYFSVDANGDGTLDQSGSGWNGYQSQDLVNLVTRSHAAGARVVLTVTCFSQSSLDAITSDPAAGARLSAALIAAVSAKNLDGVNFDFEGEGSADQVGLTRLITQVSGALHAANPHWQVTMATYASAAGDSSGFYNVAALAPALDGFFVMAYDMNDRSTPGPTAPLVSGGYSDTKALQQFTAVVPPQKVILGVPYYGYDWPTTDGTRTAQATGGESPLSAGVIASSGHPTYWDPSTDTAWTSYQVGSQWHETYFDDPTSLALKAQLADSFHIAGLGIWALGMDGNNPAMLAALLGRAPAIKDLQTGPTAVGAGSSTTTAPPGAGFVSTGVWKGIKAPLTPVVGPPSAGVAQYLGTLTRFTTNAPALACLQNGPPLAVWTFSTLPGVDVVVASQPTDCAAALWTFPASIGATGSGSGTTTTTVPPTTTTTVPPTTTTTTSAPGSTTTSTSSPANPPLGQASNQSTTTSSTG